MHATLPPNSLFFGTIVESRSGNTHTQQMNSGTLKEIYVASGPGAPPQRLERVRAVPGQGLAGDRYFFKTGTYSKKDDGSRELTLIDDAVLAESLAALGPSLLEGGHRRNLVTAGVDLEKLVHSRFKIGDVEVEGVRYCDPCGYLAEITDPRAFDFLCVPRGGLRVRILNEGELAVGDVITVPA